MLKSLLFATVVISALVSSIKAQDADLELTEISIQNSQNIIYKDQNGKTYHAIATSATLDENYSSKKFWGYAQFNRSDLPKKLSLNKISSIILPVENKQAIEVKRDTLYQDIKSERVYDVIPYFEFSNGYSTNYDFALINYPQEPMKNKEFRNPKLKESQKGRWSEINKIEFQGNVSLSPFLRRDRQLNQ